MELNPEISPLKTKSNPLSTSELDLGMYGWMVVNTQGNLSLLRTLKEIHKEGEQNMDLPAQNQPPSELKKFLMSDHDSPFLKLETLKSYLESAQQNVSIIDETDSSGKCLYDFIPDEEKQNLQSQLESLSDISNIKETLETNIQALAPEIWEDHKKIKKALRKENQQELESLLLGQEGDTEKNKNSLKEITQNSQEMQEVSEMICLEKCRVALNAISADTKNREEKEHEAELFLGADYPLIKAQVLHLEKCMERDWETALKCDWAEGISPSIINPTSGVDLLCPEILSKMKEPSAEQIKALEDFYCNMALKKTEKESVPEKENERIAFLLGSMTVLEESKKAKFMNKILSLEDEINPELEKDSTKPDVEKENELARLQRYLEARKKIKSGILQVMLGIKNKGTAAVMGYFMKEAQMLTKGQYGQSGQERLVKTLKEVNGQIDQVI